MFTDFTNDILSYYKEFVLRGERDNFVGNFADTHRMQQGDVLWHLVSYTPKVSVFLYFCPSLVVQGYVRSIVVNTL